jgi:hypothetical protein
MMLLMHNDVDEANAEGGVTMAYNQSTTQETGDGPGDSYGGGSTFYGIETTTFVDTPRNNDGIRSQEQNKRRFILAGRDGRVHDRTELPLARTFLDGGV